MTLFGKLVMGIFGIFVVGSIVYGVTSFMKEDNETNNPQPVIAQQETLPATSSEVVASTTASTTADVVATTTKATTGDTKKVSFVDFMRKGGSYKCAVSQKMANMVSDGTVYLHDALVRVEFSTTLAGQSLTTTMIARDGYMYSWTSMSPGKGYKTKIPDATSASSAKGTYTWNGSQVVDYSCAPWKADDSFFDLPKSVVFTESQ